MPENEPDAARGEPDDVGAPGHAGGTYAGRDDVEAAQRSRVRDQGEPVEITPQDDESVEQASPVRDDVNARAARDLDY